MDISYPWRKVPMDTSIHGEGGPMDTPIHGKKGYISGSYFHSWQSYQLDKKTREGD